MNFERRMPRFDKIQILEPPNNIEEWYENEKYSEEEINVFRLRNIWLLKPEIEKEIFNIMIKKIKDNERKNTYAKQSKYIRTENNVEILFKLFNDKEYYDVHAIILDKIESLDTNFYKKYIDMLKNKYDDIIFDNALRFLVRKIKVKDITEEILELLRTNSIRDPQDFASLVQIMGFQNNEKNIKYLYSYYNFFKNNFGEENYFEGPLYGISYIIEKRLTTASTL